jgi:four helix bundle protein
MQERGKELEERTATFASNVLRFVRSLPKAAAEQVLGRQLLKAGTAVGANYRAARRSRSKKEFLARLAIVVEESDESVYWLELLARDPASATSDIVSLLQEAQELRAIFATSLRTASSRP